MRPAFPRRRCTPRHLAPRQRAPRRATVVRAGVSADLRIGRTAARALALVLASLVLVVPAGLGPTSTSAAARPSAAAPTALFQAAGQARSEIIEVRGRVVRKQVAQDTVAHKELAVDRVGWVRPGVGILTSPFGMRWGKLHKGIDLGGPYGSAIYAASAGVVTFAGYKNGYNRYVTVSHGHGVVTAYAHMSATMVHVGEHVRAGQLIAREGSLGSGPHLHFEVYVGGQPVNPLRFLRKHGVYI